MITDNEYMKFTVNLALLEICSLTCIDEAYTTIKTFNVNWIHFNF